MTNKLRIYKYFVQVSYENSINACEFNIYCDRNSCTIFKEKIDAFFVILSKIISTNAIDLNDFIV